jgi:hypothetical protein
LLVPLFTFENPCAKFIQKFNKFDVALQDLPEFELHPSSLVASGKHGDFGRN